MDELIAWSGFLGAWLLFAGPIFQAAIELREGYAWPDTAFWALAVAMSALGVVNTVALLRRGDAMARDGR